MPGADFGTVLTILRIIRGWSQEDLASASGLRRGTISDYERGKMVPGHNTLKRLLDAMGYPLSALDQAGAFIDSMRAESPPMEPSADLWFTSGPAALRREVDQISAEAGRVMSRLTRLLFVVMSSPAANQDESGVAQETRST